MAYYKFYKLSIVMQPQDNVHYLHNIHIYVLILLVKALYANVIHKYEKVQYNL